MRVVLPVLIGIAIIIYTLVCVVWSNSDQTRRLPKSVWLILVIALPLIGALAWWVWGRPTDDSAPPGPTAPDDDPDFLRSLRH
ncbi:MAG: PLD nuclease N-terminal domain-containing protein [Propionibacteriaceae bacterium]|jgi:hypothetical protein|nr:PLD nuclease N-terminal domain-containing protein [Propionibacteriaceae bacterium]